MADSANKDESGGLKLGGLPVAEVLKQGQVFFILLLVFYAFWVGAPRAWFEVKGFIGDVQRDYRDLAEKQTRDIKETSQQFSASIDKLVGEMKAGNEALRRFAEAEERENARRRDEQP